MDKPISVGDLVVVVRYAKKFCGCGGKSNTIGRIFRVHDIRMSENRRCVDCNARKPDAIVAYPENDPNNLIYTLDRLKRIPPLGELESEKNDSKLTEPA